MKILHIVDYLMPTMGYQEFLLPKFNAKEKNVKVYILTGNKYYPVPNYKNTWQKFLGDRSFRPRNEIIDNVNINRSRIDFEISNRPWINNLEKNIERIYPDIIMVHGTSSFSSLRAVRTAKRLKVPIVLDNHMVFSVIKRNIIGKIYYFVIKKFISKYIGKYASIIFGVTKETCKYLVEFEGYNKKKVELLTLGVDSEKFFITKKNYEKKSQPFRIIQTGKLNIDKRPDLLANAVILLLDKKFDVTLDFYGSGDNKIIEQIKNIFNQKNYLSKLKFNNFVKYEDLYKVYNDSDLCVFPYGTSLSAVECAFCGTNVIMTNDDASIEREIDGVGKCYKTGDIKDLAKNIEFFITKNKQLNYLKQATNRVTNLRLKYDYKYISKNLLNKFEKIINEHKK